MATDNKTTKAEPAPKAEAKKDKSSSGESGSKTDSGSKADSGSKSDSGEKAAAAPASYSRGEGQKPVTAAYKENWNAIFAKKKSRKSKG